MAWRPASYARTCDSKRVRYSLLLRCFYTMLVTNVNKIVELSGFSGRWLIPAPRIFWIIWIFSPPAPKSNYFVGLPVRHVVFSVRWQDPELALPAIGRSVQTFRGGVVPRAMRKPASFGGRGLI